LCPQSIGISLAMKVPGPGEFMSIISSPERVQLLKVPRRDALTTAEAGAAGVTPRAASGDTTLGPSRALISPSPRPVALGKFLFAGGEKLFVRGVTYRLRRIHRSLPASHPTVPAESLRASARLLRCYTGPIRDDSPPRSPLRPRPHKPPISARKLRHTRLQHPPASQPVRCSTLGASTM